MKKINWFFVIVFFLFLIIFFNEKVVEKYFFYKTSNWLERKVDFDEFKYNFPGHISVYGLKVRNKDTKFYKNTFKADKILPSAFPEYLIPVNCFRILPLSNLSNSNGILI